MKVSLRASDSHKVDDQTRACMKLWAAVVSMAIRDSTLQPVKIEGLDDKDTIHRPSPEALNAMYFLFDETSNLVNILEILDINAVNFRRKILDKMYSDKRKSDEYFMKEINERHRRNFRYNHNEYMKRTNIGVFK